MNFGDKINHENGIGTALFWSGLAVMAVGAVTFLFLFTGGVPVGISLIPLILCFVSALFCFGFGEIVELLHDIKKNTADLQRDQHSALNSVVDKESYKTQLKNL